MTTLLYALIVVGLAASTVLVLFLSMLAASAWRDHQKRREARDVAVGRFEEFDRMIDEDFAD